MKALPKDILFKTIIDLPPMDIVNLSATDKSFNKKNSNLNEFWVLKLQKDYPYLYKSLPKPINNAKNEYIKEFTFLAKTIEKGYSKLFDMIKKDFLQFMDIKSYKNYIFSKIYEKYQSMNLNLSDSIKNVDDEDLTDDDEQVDEYLLNLAFDTTSLFIPFAHGYCKKLYQKIDDDLKGMFYELWFHKQQFGI
jgi:DNA replicative helicase MCM subunit Mcm2 (Cdc46/Mcm family)